MKESRRYLSIPMTPEKWQKLDLLKDEVERALNEKIDVRYLVDFIVFDFLDNSFFKETQKGDCNS